jgi:hypothetical protein
MNMRKVLLLGVLLTALYSVSLYGCAYTDPQAAAATAQAFMEAGKKGDRQAWEATLTEKARQEMDTQVGKKVNVKDQVPGGYTIGQPTITDDTAEVPVTVKGKDQNAESETTIKLKMRREKGDWRVYAMTLPTTPDGPEFTVDFENTAALLGEIMKQVPQGMNALGAGLNALGDGFKAAGESLQKSAADAAAKNGQNLVR